MTATLGEKLRVLRRLHKLTQKQFCRCLHITRAAYCNYENNQRSPSVPLIVQIADFYHIPVDYLIRDDIALTDYPFLRHFADDISHLLAQMEPEISQDVLFYASYRLQKQLRSVVAEAASIRYEDLKEESADDTDL